MSGVAFVKAPSLNNFSIHSLLDCEFFRRNIQKVYTINNSKYYILGGLKDGSLMAIQLGSQTAQTINVGVQVTALCQFGGSVVVGCVDGSLHRVSVHGEVGIFYLTSFDSEVVSIAISDSLNLVVVATKTRLVTLDCSFR